MLHRFADYSNFIRGIFYVIDYGKVSSHHSLNFKCPDNFRSNKSHYQLIIVLIFVIFKSKTFLLER